MKNIQETAGKNLIFTRRTLAQFFLSDRERTLLAEVTASMTASEREKIRAKVLLHYADGVKISSIQQQLGISRPTIYKYLERAIEFGICEGLKDACHSPKNAEILDSAKSWVVRVACSSPRICGCPCDMWTLATLSRFVSDNAEDVGFPRLKKATKTTIWRILQEYGHKPYQIRSYLQRFYSSEIYDLVD